MRNITKSLTACCQHSMAFAAALKTVMGQINHLHPHHVAGLVTHLERVHGSLERKIATLRQHHQQATNNPTKNPTDNQTKNQTTSPSGSQQ
jgi:hypothetical protein